jgi:hypothetical protein
MEETDAIKDLRSASIYFGGSASSIRKYLGDGILFFRVLLLEILTEFQSELMLDEKN